MWPLDINNNHKGRKLMDVEQLINELKKYPKDMLVQYDYENYLTINIDSINVEKINIDGEKQEVVVLT